MPKGMDLQNEGTAPENLGKDPAGIAFALRALACINVHDSEAAQKQELTLRQISDADPYMKEHGESLTAYLFRAFGRNCTPVLMRYLQGVQSPEDLEVNIKAYARKLESILGL